MGPTGVKFMSLSGGSANTTSKSESARISRTEEFFRKIYQQAPTGIAITDWRGVFQECNSAYCTLLGYTEKELQAADFASLIHPEDREANLALVRRLQAGEIPSFDTENRYIHKNGEQVWVHKFVSALHDEQGEPTHLIALVTNITQRKQAEEARIRSAAIVESSDDAIVATDVSGAATDWNNGAERLFGYLASEAIGKNISFLVPANRRDEAQHILKKVINGEAVKRHETLGQSKDGNPIEVSLTVTPIVDNGGRIAGAAGIARDIRERKLAEQVLLGMTRKLVEAQEQERARIARELHDDINQRLAVLAIEIERLRGHNDLSCEVHRCVHELQELTADLSSRVYALSYELHSSALDVLGLVKGVKSWCKEFAARREMQIDFKGADLPGLSPEISLCLFRVLQEALQNAAKYSGVRRIEVQLTENSGEIHLVVSDSGRGFDIEAARREGGLGLTSMQERVRLVGGTIAIESKPMRGTTIHVRVPLESKRHSQPTAV
jgi:PAS domain S-box-containing protein